MKRERLLMIFAFAAIYGIWGSTYLAISYAIESVPPLLMAGVRSFVAGAILFSWVRMRGAPMPAASEWRAPLIAGGLLFLGGQGLLAWSEQYVATGPAAVLNATIPLFVVLLGWKGGAVTGRSEPVRPSPAKMAALVLGLAGVMLLVGFGDGEVMLLPAVVVTVSALSWALGSFRASVPQMDAWPVRRSAMQLIGGGTLLVAAGVVTGEASRLEIDAITFRSLAALVYLIVFGSLIAYSAYVWLLSRIGPARVSSHAYVNPLVALLLGWMIGGESLSLRSVTASGLIVVSVALIVAAGAKRLDATRPRAGMVTRTRESMSRWLAGMRRGRIYAGISETDPCP
jgi:drug/metabolite transporter (DMT)-like permease